MGLAFNYGNAHWSYGGFMRFRQKIVKTLGYMGDLQDLYYHPDNGKIDFPEIIKQSGLFDLINHSDCDGHLTPEQMRKIIPALTHIISNWELSDYDRKNAKDLIEGMEKAIEDDADLEFC